jgi:hypothetical protein
MADILTDVKSVNGITGEYHDRTLEIYIIEVKEYMVSAGISEDVLNSDMSAGAIVRGVTDLWLNGTLSDYFYQRVTQLKYKEGDADV